VKNDYGTEWEAKALNGLEEPLNKRLLINPITNLNPVFVTVTRDNIKYCVFIPI
jgi:hypothetical protein